MKKAFLMIMLVSLGMSSAFADRGDDHRRHHDRSRSKVSTTVITGKNAKALYEALSQMDVTTRDTRKFSMDIKKVGGLTCAKMTKKEDTKKVFYHCSLKGKKLDRRRDRRDCDHHHRSHHRHGRRDRDRD